MKKNATKVLAIIAILVMAMVGGIIGCKDSSDDKYYVTFTVQGITTGAPSYDKIEIKDGKITLPAQKDVEGYTFKHFLYGATEYAPADVLTLGDEITANVNVKVVYEVETPTPDTYSVKFVVVDEAGDLIAGAASYANITIPEDGIVEMPASITVAGYEFLYFRLGETTKAATETFEFSDVEEDVTVEAVYAEVFYATFVVVDENGDPLAGATISNIKIVEGKIELPDAVPAIENYTFSHFEYDGDDFDFEDEIDFGEVTANAIVTAVYEADGVVIFAIVDANGDPIDTAVTYAVVEIIDGEATMPAAKNVDGNKFLYFEYDETEYAPTEIIDFGTATGNFVVNAVYAEVLSAMFAIVDVNGDPIDTTAHYSSVEIVLGIATMPAVEMVEGYNFLYFEYDGNEYAAGAEIDFGAITENTTVNAVYKEKIFAQFEVVDVNGDAIEDHGTIYITTEIVDGVVTMPAVQNIDGYTFLYFEYDGDEYAAGADIDFGDIAADATVKVVYGVKLFVQIIIVDANKDEIVDPITSGGSPVAYDDVEIIEGTATMPASKTIYRYTFSHYEFNNGVFLISVDPGGDFNFASATENVTVSAVYNAKPYLVYVVVDENGDEIIGATNRYPTDTEIVSGKATTSLWCEVDGYEFLHFTYNGTIYGQQVQITFPTGTNTSQTINAVYSKISYVVFEIVDDSGYEMLNPGVSYTNIKIESGKATMPAVKSISGYSFVHFEYEGVERAAGGQFDFAAIDGAAVTANKTVKVWYNEIPLSPEERAFWDYVTALENAGFVVNRGTDWQGNPLTAFGSDPARIMADNSWVTGSNKPTMTASYGSIVLVNPDAPYPQVGIMAPSDQWEAYRIVIFSNAADRTALTRCLTNTYSLSSGTDFYVKGDTIAIFANSYGSGCFVEDEWNKGANLFKAGMPNIYGALGFFTASFTVVDNLDVPISGTAYTSLDVNGGSITLPASKAISGYPFLYFEYNEIQYDAGDTITGITSNAVIKAVYGRPYFAQFEIVEAPDTIIANPGASYAEVAIIGGKITLPAAINIANYSFVKYVYGGSDYAAGAEVTITETNTNVTIKAVYGRAYYASFLIFDIDELPLVGTGITFDNVQIVDGQITLPAGKSVHGYEFVKFTYGDVDYASGATVTVAETGTDIWVFAIFQTVDNQAVFTAAHAALVAAGVTVADLGSATANSRYQTSANSWFNSATPSTLRPTGAYGSYRISGSTFAATNLNATGLYYFPDTADLERVIQAWEGSYGGNRVLGVDFFVRGNWMFSARDLASAVGGLSGANSSGTLQRIANIANIAEMIFDIVNPSVGGDPTPAELFAGYVAAINASRFSVHATASSTGFGADPGNVIENLSPYPTTFDSEYGVIRLAATTDVTNFSDFRILYFPNPDDLAKAVATLVGNLSMENMNYFVRGDFLFSNYMLYGTLTPAIRAVIDELFAILTAPPPANFTPEELFADYVAAIEASRFDVHSMPEYTAFGVDPGETGETFESNYGAIRLAAIYTPTTVTFAGARIFFFPNANDLAKVTTKLLSKGLAENTDFFVRGNLIICDYSLTAGVNVQVQSVAIEILDVLTA